jgi:hypothetical protein
MNGSTAALHRLDRWLYIVSTDAKTDIKALATVEEALIKSTIKDR